MDAHFTERSAKRFYFGCEFGRNPTQASYLGGLSYLELVSHDFPFYREFFLQTNS